MSSSNTIQLPVCSNSSKDTNQQQQQQPQSLSYKATNTSRIKNFFWNKLTRPRGGSAKNITITAPENENNTNGNEKKHKKNLLLTFFESSSSSSKTKNGNNKKSTKKVFIYLSDLILKFQ